MRKKVATIAYAWDLIAVHIGKTVKDFFSYDNTYQYRPIGTKQSKDFSQEQYTLAIYNYIISQKVTHITDPETDDCETPIAYSKIAQEANMVKLRLVQQAIWDYLNLLNNETPTTQDQYNFCNKLQNIIDPNFFEKRFSALLNKQC